MSAGQPLNTHPQVEALLIEGYRKMSPAQELEVRVSTAGFHEVTSAACCACSQSGTVIPGEPDGPFHVSRDEESGRSPAMDDPRGLPKHRKPQALGGEGRDPIFSLPVNAVGKVLEKMDAVWSRLSAEDQAVASAEPVRSLVRESPLPIRTMVDEDVWVYRELPPRRKEAA